MSSNVVNINAGRHRAAVVARRDELIEDNLELVHQVARAIVKTLPACFELDDLIGAGNIGLMQAATRYRPSAHGGTPFSAYARPVIRGAILDSVKRSEWRNATADSLEGVPERAVVVRIDEAIDARRRIAQVNAAVEGLDARHASVIDWHYREEMGLRDVAGRLGVGKSRASQLHMEAVRTLRDALR